MKDRLDICNRYCLLAHRLPGTDKFLFDGEVLADGSVHVHSGGGNAAKVMAEHCNPELRRFNLNLRVESLGFDGDGNLGVLVRPPR